MKIALIATAVLAVATSVWTWKDAFARKETAAAETSDAYLNVSDAPVKEEQVALLHVVTWNNDEKKPVDFEVKQKDGRWIIPSRYNYPADGSGGRVGKTAGGVLNLRPGPEVTNKPQEHAQYGVVDPESKESVEADARGKRVTVRGADGAALVDLIIGKKSEVEGLYYVRKAGQDSVCTAKLSIDISTQFKDWVELGLLKVERGSVRMLNVLNYSVDNGGVQSRVNIKVTKPKDAQDWAAEKLPEGKLLNTNVIDDVLDELNQLRLADVRPMDPNELRENGFHLLPASPEALKLSGGLKVQTTQGLGTILGNDGSLVVGMNDGMSYHMSFGSATTAGKSTPDKTPDPKVPEVKTYNRFLVIFVTYDAALDEAAAGKTTEAEKKKALEEVQKRIEKGVARYQVYYYVISDESFKKLRPAPETLFRDKELSKDKLPGEKVPEDKALVTIAGGEQYVDLKVGTGPEAVEGDKVMVHYTGYLEDGKKFDSSLDSGKPFEVEIGRSSVIGGWHEGLKGMRVGGKRKLVIPPQMGYGSAGHPPTIPANARLIFDIEVLDLQSKNAKPGEKPDAGLEEQIKKAIEQMKVDGKLTPKPPEKAIEKPAEKPSEAPKPEVKTEAPKPAEKPADKSAEAPKPEPKAEQKPAEKAPEAPKPTEAPKAEEKTDAPK